MKYENKIFDGDYVLSPCKNAFNQNYSFWLSKKDMTVAMYCFTVTPGGFSYEHQVKEIHQYIKLFQEKYEKANDKSYNSQIIQKLEEVIGIPVLNPGGSINALALEEAIDKITKYFKEFEWFDSITEKLRDYSEGDIWTTGDEIMCKTESAAEALADMFECLYRAQGEEILVNTGYYDPVEDERNNEVDRHTGWWYVNIG